MNESESDSDQWVVSNLNSGLTRRRMIGATVTVIGGGTGLAVAGSDSARAQASVEEVSVSSEPFQAASIDPVIDATVAYAYRHDTPTELVFELLVDESVIASQSLRTSSTELENTTDLSGRVIDSSAWEASDFDADRGETIERDVTVGVRFAVLENDSVVVEDFGTASETIVVQNPNDSTASVGLQATITDGS